MSFEGHHQRLCENGHLFEEDAAGDEDAPPLRYWQCPECGAMLAWSNLVDDTNDWNWCGDAVDLVETQPGVYKIPRDDGRLYWTDKDRRKNATGRKKGSPLTQKDLDEARKRVDGPDHACFVIEATGQGRTALASELRPEGNTLKIGGYATWQGLRVRITRIVCERYMRDLLGG